MARRRGKHHEGEHENLERWLITYADLITLLLIFFVVMYSISQADLAKFRQVATSLRAAFNLNVLSAPPPGQSMVTPLEQDPRFNAYLSVRAQVGALFTRLGLDRQDAEVELTTEGIVIHLSDAVLFPPGQAELRPEAQRVLDGIAAIVEPLPNAIRVEGHTDNTPPPSAAYPDNWELSAMRAVNTVRYLTDVAGLPPERLSAAGYGEFRPRASNETVEGRRKNRRVDIVILQPAFGATP
ncbi:MAG: flagellar motor protein MotB [Thermomicrobium sp.]|nr:OmpA family protein [Thermomicrobium sp.]MDW8059396.1 flagellar motor protein MotB [Thermomicrobium sp.]